MAPTDKVVGGNGDEHPRYEVEWSRGRHGGRATEDEREVDVLKEGESERLVQDPLEERHDGADKEEHQQSVVDLTIREQTLRSDHAPLRHDKLSIHEQQVSPCNLQ